MDPSCDREPFPGGCSLENKTARGPAVIHIELDMVTGKILPSITVWCTQAFVDYRKTVLGTSGDFKSNTIWIGLIGTESESYVDQILFYLGGVMMLLTLNHIPVESYAVAD